MNNRQQSQQAVKQLSQQIEVEIISLGIDIVSNLRSNPPLGTPIDTGWASSNWIPSVGSPVTRTFGNKARVSTAAQEAGIAALAKWKIGKGNIYIANNVPYIGVLDNGTSKQSPKNFVRIAIEKAILSSGLKTKLTVVKT